MCGGPATRQHPTQQQKKTRLQPIGVSHLDFWVKGLIAVMRHETVFFWLIRPVNLRVVTCPELCWLVPVDYSLRGMASATQKRQ